MPEFRILDPQPDDLRDHKGPLVQGNFAKRLAKVLAVLDEKEEFPIVCAVYHDTGDTTVVYQFSPGGRKRIKGGDASEDDNWDTLFAAEEVMTEQEKYEELLRVARAVVLATSDQSRGHLEREALIAALKNFD